MIQAKRVYDEPKKQDGFRILVDRLWPRGVSKEDAKVDLWIKEISPSDKLRKWFSHDPKKWSGFKKKYKAELKTATESLNKIKQIEHDPNQIPDVIRPILTGESDIVIGSRFLNDSDRKRVPGYRSFGIAARQGIS